MVIKRTASGRTAEFCSDEQQGMFGGRIWKIGTLVETGFGSRQSIYALIRAGQIEAFKMRSGVRIVGDSIDRYIQSRRFGK